MERTLEEEVQALISIGVDPTEACRVVNDERARRAVLVHHNLEKAPVAPALPVADVEFQNILVSTVKRAYSEMETEREECTIAFSKATNRDVVRLVEKLSILVLEDELELALSPNLAFAPFDWGNDNSQNEAVQTPAAVLHLQNELTKFGCMFGRNNWKLLDLHSWNDSLSFDDPKIGKLSGGTDIALVPFKTAQCAAASEMCMIFELKTEVEIRRKGFSSFYPQVFCEILACRCRSHQPQVVAILTDLSHGAAIYRVVLENDIFRICISEVTLDQMATFVSGFCNNTDCAVPDALYTPRPTRPADAPVIAFKQKMFAHSRSDSLEMLLDHLEHVKPWDFERSHVFSPRDCNDNQPFMSMYY